MTEAVTCLSDLALTAMGMDRIILIAHLENKASIRVAEKSGFKLVSRFKEQTDTLVPCVIISALRRRRTVSKHQEILDYLEALPIGKRVSVRSISNHLQVSDGTAYRPLKKLKIEGWLRLVLGVGRFELKRKSKFALTG